MLCVCCVLEVVVRLLMGVMVMATWHIYSSKPKWHHIDLLPMPGEQICMNGVTCDECHVRYTPF